MKRFSLFAVPLFLLALGLPGRAEEVKPQLVKETAFVFGYVGLGEAPAPPKWCQYMPVPTPKDKKGLTFKMEDGVFYGDDVKPGDYKLYDFVGEGIYSAPLAGNWWFVFGDKEGGFSVPQPGQFHYVGSFRVRKGSDDALKNDYYAERTAYPNELEILKEILPHLKDNPWAPLVSKRIGELTAQVTPTSPNELAPVNLPSPTPDIPSLP